VNYVVDSDTLGSTLGSLEPASNSPSTGPLAKLDGDYRNQRIEAGEVFRVSGVER
jgi:hypothetical protein